MSRAYFFNICVIIFHHTERIFIRYYALHIYIYIYIVKVTLKLHLTIYIYIVKVTLTSARCDTVFHIRR